MSELERYVAQLLAMRKQAAAADDPDTRNELVRQGSDLAQAIRALVGQRAGSEA